MKIYAVQQQSLYRMKFGVVAFFKRKNVTHAITFKQGKLMKKT
jgi:hypothetical protein